MSNARKLSRLIVGTELVASNVDSDLSNRISSIKTRLDSDDSKIQSLNTSLDNVSSVAGLLDSDLKVVADLRNQLDSEIIYVRNLSLSYTNFLYNATDGQTTFQDSDANSTTLAYTAGAIQVFLNGIKLQDDDYTATDGTSIVLTEAAITNAQLIIVCPKLESNIIITGFDWSSHSLSQSLQYSGTKVASSLFGEVISIDGDYAVVTARNLLYDSSKRGKAFVFYKSGSTWAQQADLTHSDSSSNNYGIDAAISGDTIAVADSAGDGAVRIFTRSGTTWSLQQKLVGNSTTMNGFADGAIGLSGDKLAVGCYAYATPGSSTGRIAIFNRSGSTWSFESFLDASDAASSDLMGYYNVGISGNYVVAGVPAKEAAYVFIRSSNYYDIANASYASKTFDFGSEDNSPTGFAFNSNGTKLFMVGYEKTLLEREQGRDDTGGCYQYSLSTPYDVSTASYDSVLLDVSAQIKQPMAMHFSSDGTRLFIADNQSASDNSDVIFQYNLTTGFDLSTASYSNNSLDVDAYETIVGGIDFKPDGTKMFIVGMITDTVRAWNLSTAWDISSASYASETFSVASQEGGPRGVTFNSTGTKMFINGQGASAEMHQYSLSSAWDVSSASYDNVSFDVTSQENAIQCQIRFNSDGSKLWMIGAGSDSIFEYSTTTVAWSQQAKITASDGASGHNFGTNVAIDGDIVVVGAAWKTSETGAAYVFTRSNTSWSETTKLGAGGSIPSDLSTGDQFGYVVDINQNSLIVSASNVASPRGNGSVYIFNTSDDGATWTQQNKFTTTSGDNTDNYGYGRRTVAIDETSETIIVGAYEDDTGATAAGKIYIYS